MIKDCSLPKKGDYTEFRHGSDVTGLPLSQLTCSTYAYRLNNRRLLGVAGAVGRMRTMRTHMIRVREPITTKGRKNPPRV